jgi:hypothetical protein
MDKEYGMDTRCRCKLWWEGLVRRGPSSCRLMQNFVNMGCEQTPAWVTKLWRKETGHGVDQGLMHD